MSNTNGNGLHAAGTLPWRDGPSGLEIALVHRPAYDDWAWSKGKLDHSERPAIAAARETWEETGYRVRLGPPLPGSDYPVSGGTKHVDYWAAQVTGGAGKLLHEIDQVAWLSPKKAAKRLTYERDKDQLAALVELHRTNALESAPLVIVRHALAVPRKQWRKRDQLRPLRAEGAVQAKALPPLLAAYGVAKLVSSSAERCATTFLWSANKLRLRVNITDRLTEEGFAAKPRAALRSIDHAAAWASKKDLGAAVCLHGPLIGTVLTHLATNADPAPRQALLRAADENMEKGEALIVHLQPRNPARRVIAIERHLP